MPANIAGSITNLIPNPATINGIGYGILNLSATLASTAPAIKIMTAR